jgi:hypothetical protein
MNLDQLEKEKARLELENNVLENEIASRSALRYVEKKAESEGFRPYGKLLYITRF